MFLAISAQLEKTPLPSASSGIFPELRLASVQAGEALVIIVLILVNSAIP
jgi:hypothetical protein